MTPAPSPSVIMPVCCDDEECGMRSAYEFWPDGSHREIVRACWHAKRLPNRAKIQAAIQKTADE